MRGTVLQYDDNAGSGYISGDDGVRYTFKRSDLQQLRPIAAGMKVDFVPNAGAANEIYMIDATGAIASGPGPAPGYGAAPAYGGGYAPAGMAPTVAYTGEDLGIWDYFKKVMAKSFNGEGRARRKEFWSFFLICAAIWTVIYVILMFTVLSAASGMYNSYAYGYYDPNPFAFLGALGVWGVVVTVLWLVFLPANITVMIRRLHDIGMSGWFILMALVPVIGAIFLLVCMFIPSQVAVNQHGAIPKPAPTVYGA
jgi:uncharacterized membrane protein YhaH (DUF805 family)